MEQSGRPRRTQDKAANCGSLAQRTRDEFYPKESLQLAEVKGLDLTLKQVLEFKYISAPMSEAEVQQGLIDILYRGNEPVGRIAERNPPITARWATPSANPPTSHKVHSARLLAFTASAST